MLSSNLTHSFLNGGREAMTCNIIRHPWNHLICLILEQSYRSCFPIILSPESFSANKVEFSVLFQSSPQVNLWTEKGGFGNPWILSVRLIAMKCVLWQEDITETVHIDPLKQLAFKTIYLGVFERGASPS